MGPGLSAAPSTLQEGRGLHGLVGGSLHRQLEGGQWGQGRLPQLLQAPPGSDRLQAPGGCWLFVYFLVATAGRRTAESWPAGGRRGSSRSCLARWGRGRTLRGAGECPPAREAASR